MKMGVEKFGIRKAKMSRHWQVNTALDSQAAIQDHAANVLAPLPISVFRAPRPVVPSPGFEATMSTL
jgi:hypothetical protein